MDTAVWRWSYHVLAGPHHKKTVCPSKTAHFGRKLLSVRGVGWGNAFRGSRAGMLGIGGAGVDEWGVKHSGDET